MSKKKSQSKTNSHSLTRQESPKPQVVKKQRGRPRKQPLSDQSKSNDPSSKQSSNPELIAFIKNAISLMKINCYREALEELSKIHDYLLVSIDFGEMQGQKKCSQEELIDIITGLFK